MHEPSVDQIQRTLREVSAGKADSGQDLLPLVYGELRRLARARMAHLPPGNTLQPTALVHEAFLRVAGDDDPGWDGRGHFFAAAAEAMRQILVDQVRRKASLKRGGGQRRLDVDDLDIPVEVNENLLDLDRALDRLQAKHPDVAQIVLLRHFAGLNREETALAMGLSKRTMDRQWEFARAWLHRELNSP